VQVAVWYSLIGNDLPRALIQQRHQPEPLSQKQHYRQQIQEQSCPWDKNQPKTQQRQKRSFRIGKPTELRPTDLQQHLVG